MKFRFNRQPCLILEATELLYVFVNQLSPRKLTAEGAYCIPPAEVGVILEQVCDQLSPKDPDLRYYFQKYPLQEKTGATCLARLMVFTFINLSALEPDGGFQSLCDTWDRLRQSGYYFTDCTDHGLCMYTPKDPEAPPFAHGLWQLPLPKPCKERLMEVFSDFPRHVKRLESLMRPVIDRLGPALAPWLSRAEPMIQQWERLQDQELMLFMETQLCIQPSAPLQSATASLLFFLPNQTPGLVDEERSMARLCIGVNVPLLKGHTWPKPEEWEYAAMRLLGSPARMEMLQAMSERPMTSRELAQELGLHLGAVTRDVRNMHESRLLVLKLGGPRPHYSANFDTLRHLGQRLLDMCPTPSDAEGAQDTNSPQK